MENRIRQTLIEKYVIYNLLLILFLVWNIIYILNFSVYIGITIIIYTKYRYRIKYEIFSNRYKSRITINESIGWRCIKSYLH